MKEFEIALDEWMTPQLEAWEDAMWQEWEEATQDQLEEWEEATEKQREEWEASSRERFDNDAGIIRARERLEDELREKFESEIWPTIMEALHE